MSVKQKVYAQEEKFRTMAAEGASRKELAKALDISVTSVDKYAKELGIEIKLQKNSTKYSDLTGQSFEISHLDVLERDFDPPFQSHETAYKCKCQLCGEIRTYRKSNIVNGPGCHKCSGIKGGRGYREWEVGDKFGLLTAIDKGERTGYIKCKCECGTIKDIKISHLKGQGRHSYTISCGCSQISSGELKIKEILEENNIPYIQGYVIKDFSPFAPFDFAILTSDGQIDRLIEYDGQQHFISIDHFGGEEKLRLQQERDERKNRYCQEHNIPLVRIPYTKYKSIDLQMLLDPLAETKN